MRKVALAMMLGVLSLGGVAAAQGAPAPPAGQTAAPMCPCMGGGGRMAGGGPMMNQANVTAENTSGGAVLRFTARDPSQVQTIQQRAQMMASCMGGSAAPSTTSPPRPMPPK